MSEQYEFAPCAPVKRPGRQGAGRRPEVNPFEVQVREVVGKTENGAPAARQASFKLDSDNGETLKQRTARIRRFLTKAGKSLAPEGGDAYNIAMVVEETTLDDVYVVKFWDRNAGRTPAPAADAADTHADAGEPTLVNA